MTAWHELTTIARNAGSSYGLRMLRGLSVVLMTPYLFRSLGPSAFGTWSVMFTLITVFTLLEEGFSAGVTRFVAQFRARDDAADLDATVGAAVTLMALLGLAAAGISVAVAFAAPGLAAAGDRDGFQAGMIVLGISMILRFPFVAFGAALMGYQRYELYNASQAVSIVAFAVGVVIAVESGSGVFGLALAYGGALVLGGVLYGVLLARIDGRLSLRPRFADRAAQRRLGGFGSLALLADSMVFIGQRMDTLVIAAVRNAATAAPFAAAIKLAGGLQSLTFPFISLLMPMVSDLQARGKHAEVVRRFTIATRVAAQLTVPAAIAFALFSSDIVDLWLGHGAPDVTASIIVALMAAQVLTMSAYPAEKVLVGMGKVRVVATLAVVEGISNIALSIVLVTSYGAIGAALGTLFTSGVLAPIKYPLACRAAGCSTLHFLKESVGAAATAALPAVAAMLAAWALLPAGALRLAVGLLAGLAVSAAVGAAQIGPRRTLTTLRRLRASGTREAAPTGAIP